MTIEKRLNCPQTPYYKVTIKGDFNDGDEFYTTRKYTEDEFNAAVIPLKFVLDNFIGDRKIREYYEDVNSRYESISDEEKEFIESISEYVDIPYYDDFNFHSIHNRSDIEIMYYDIDGKCYNVNLED